MSWNVEVKEPGTGNFETAPEGNWGARVCAIIDVGFHDARDKDGSVYQRRTAVVAFELAAKKSDGTPFIVARTVTLSLSLSSILYGWIKTLSGPKAIGEQFDPGWLAKQGCLVQITHSTKTRNGKERTYANIQAVTALPQGMPYPQGQCIVWTITERDRVPLPNVDHLPSLYHEDTGKMLTVPEWVKAANDHGAPSRAADSRMPTGSHPHERPAHPALSNYPAGGFRNLTGDDIPF